jgi:predicted methyltransferase
MTDSSLDGGFRMKRVCLVLTLLFCCHSWVGAAEKPSKTDNADSNQTDLQWREQQHLSSVLPFLNARNGEVIAALEGDAFRLTYMLSLFVGGGGKVYMIDVGEKRFDEWHASQHQFYENLYPLDGPPDKADLPAGELDVVFIINSWYRIKNPKTYVQSLAGSLAPGGRVMVLDFRAGDTSWGPPKKQRTSREDLINQFEQGGWQLTAESTALADQYFLVFSPAAD